MKDLVKFLQTLPNSPRIIREWLAIYGVKETPGPGNNPIIMGWIKELGGKFAWVKDDKTPWCSTAMALVANRSGKNIAMVTPGAISWATFGTRVSIGEAVLGDTLVFSRKGGHHVATYVAESSTSFYIIGGNQGDKVSIIRKLKKDCIAARRPEYKIGIPEGCKKYFISDQGEISTNEA